MLYMLKILKIKVSGYKLLGDDFTIDLTTKARVNNDELEKEIFEIDKKLYSYRTLSFVGCNSSGKSTILTLILKSLSLLQTGRWEFVKNEFHKETISLEIDFYLNEYIYSYSVILNKPDMNNIGTNNPYALIENEKLYRIKYDKYKSKNSSHLIKEDISNSLNSLIDTSSIVNITRDNINVDYFNTNNISNINEVLVRNTFFESLKKVNDKLLSSIIQLLDESIEYIKPSDKDNIRFKRFNEDEMILTNIEILNILSSGTFRGVELYIRAINALKYGKVFIVDEIENSFQKNLVSNLLFLFNDEKINKYNAQLIFSTHYTEILDYISRRDSIFITHKENGIINISNLYNDYNIRCELSKSRLFDNNVFNTSINYDMLKTVRRNLIDELYSNND